MLIPRTQIFVTVRTTAWRAQASRSGINSRRSPGLKGTSSALC
ncbi:hypothetical protein GGE12_006069 [Rhizobium mongolense]|uniref:Uncharacterized protein n=1 Tax=Rhizobium mongolense TaxID=57676 RepID=A0A7W6WI00_9HYPH|nr:hypothetical protein [Rhizobium mongolense]